MFIADIVNFLDINIVMAKDRTLYQKIKDCDENKLFSIFVKLFDGNFINMNMINKAYSEHLIHSKKNEVISELPLT